MDIIEKKYRDTPKTHKKYVKRLSDFINTLLDHGRVIESKYYFSELILLKPLHTKTNVLGYKLAIKTFDNRSVIKFDGLLFEQRYKAELLLLLRLQYYYSVNNTKYFEEVACNMLDENSLGDETFNEVAQLILSKNCYDTVASLCHYLKRKNKHFNQVIEKRVQKIVLQRFLECLIEAKK